MLFLRRFHVLSLVVASLAMAATAADNASVSGKSFLIKLTRDGLADGTDTLVFEEKAVTSLIPDALFIGAVKIKGRLEGESVEFEGKAKCVQGGRGRLIGSIRGSSITGSLACSGDESYTMEFQGLQVARAVASDPAEEPRYRISPVGPAQETAAGRVSSSAAASATPAAAPAADPVATPVATPAAVPAAAPADAPAAASAVPVPSAVPAEGGTAPGAAEAPAPPVAPASPATSPAEPANGVASAESKNETSAPAAPVEAGSIDPGSANGGASQAVSPDENQKDGMAGMVPPVTPAE